MAATQSPAQAPKTHGLIAKIFHWGFIVVFIYALSKQLGSVDDLAEPGLLRFEVIFALAFLALLAVRYVYMRMTLPSALPWTTPRTMKLAARAGHLAMYVSLAMIAVSGLLIGAIYAAGAETGIAMDMAVGLHEISILATYLSIALHVAAAIFHRFKGDGVWSSMVPVFKENKP